MKVITPGREQTGWSKECHCTGSGNGGGGCQALLLVEAGDIFRTSNQSYGDSSPTYYDTFKCQACGVLTDIKGVPSSVTRRDQHQREGDK